VWAGLGMLQVLFWCLVYPALVEDKLAQFTDICSIANIRHHHPMDIPQVFWVFVIKNLN